MEITAIVFDFFGVICSEVARPWYLKHELPISYEDLRAKYIYQFDRGDLPANRLWNILGELSNTPPEEVKEEWLSIARIDTGVIDEIHVLQRDYKIAFCTNANADFFWDIIDRNNLRELFKTVVISSEEGVVKPDPQIYKTLIQRVQSDPEGILLVDDREGNVLGAESLGLNGLLYTSLPDLNNKLLEYGIMLK